jgi:hypothetical protein
MASKLMPDVSSLKNALAYLSDVLPISPRLASIIFKVSLGRYSRCYEALQAFYTAAFVKGGIWFVGYAKIFSGINNAFIKFKNRVGVLL